MELLKNINASEVLFFDIETARLNKELKIDSQEFDAWNYKHNKEDKLSNEELQQLYVDRAALEPEFAKIICISMGMIVNDELYIKSYAGKDEEKLLRDFNNDLERTQASVRKLKLSGWAVIGFDIPFVFKRCMVNGVTPSSMLETAGEKPWTMAEKVLDLKELWKGTSFAPTSLICATVALGIPHPKDDISGKDVGRVFYSEGAKGLKRIAAYCEKDVLSSANVFCRLRFEPLIGIAKEEIEAPKPVPLMEKLASGVSFTAAMKKKVEDFVADQSAEEQETAIQILEALAESKTSKVTKTFIKQLKERHAVTA